MSEMELDSSSPGKRKLSTDENNAKDEETNKRRKSEDSEPTTSDNNAVVKTEKLEKDASSETEQNGDSIPVTIKAEPVEESESAAVHSADPEPSTSSNDPTAVVKTEPNNDSAVPESSTSSSAPTVVVKTEPTNNAAPVATGTQQNNNAAPIAAATPPVNTNQSPVADSSVSSSTLRPSCRFGIRCYRQNPAHRIAEAHPGDADYRRPSFPAPPLGTPVCPFGNLCYRRNPVHFQQYSHPADFNSAQNIRNRLRQRRVQLQNPHGPIPDYSDEEEDDEEDPFHDEAGSDLDYKPGAQDDDDEEEDELEFNSERQNCDEFD